MSEWSLMRGGGIIDVLGAVPGSSGPTILTAGAANTKGAYGQLIASTAHALSALMVKWRSRSADGNSSIDIAIGAGGSEQIIVPDLFGFSTSRHQVAFLPIGIAKATRVAARVQSLAGATTHDVTIIGVGYSPLTPRGLTAADIVGYTPASTSAVVLDGGAVANTDTAWAELTSGLAKPAKFLYPQFLQATVPGASGDLLVDIGVGAGGSEQVLIPDISIRNTAAGPSLVFDGPYPVNLPVGTRLACRLRSSSTNAGTRTLGVALLTLR